MLTDEQAALARLMSDISEECYAAGWLHGLEFTLWAFVCGEPMTWPWDGMPDSAIDELTRRAVAIGGWIVWHPDDGETFIPMEEWLHMYRRDTLPRVIRQRAESVASEPFTDEELDAIWVRLANPDCFQKACGCMADPHRRVILLRERIRAALANSAPQEPPHAYQTQEVK